MVEYDSTHDGYVHPDYPDRLFHALTEPPSMTNQETMVEQSFMPLPNEVDDDVFAAAVRAAIDNHPHLNPDDDVDAVNYFERLYDESHTLTDAVTTYDELFIQFGITTEGNRTFGMPFVQVYGARPHPDADDDRGAAPSDN